VIEKQKIGKNSLFSTLRLSNVSVRFEALFKTAECELKNYEKVDGNFVEIRCLTAESLIKEKISAYQTRLKVRDLYDIFFLLKYANNKEKIKKDLDSLMKKFRTPIDWGDLKVLIIEGLVPRTNEMLVYIGKNY
jgi:predicted nucleotidyltransferase component of viral defense system